MMLVGVLHAGTAETGAGNLGQVRRDAQALMNELCAASSMGPLHGAFALPVLLQGANGQFQVMHQLAVGTAASQQQQQQQQPGLPVRASPAFLSCIQRRRHRFLDAQCSLFLHNRTAPLPLQSCMSTGPETCQGLYVVHHSTSAPLDKSSYSAAQ